VSGRSPPLNVLWQFKAAFNLRRFNNWKCRCIDHLQWKCRCIEYLAFEYAALLWTSPRNVDRRLTANHITCPRYRRRQPDGVEWRIKSTDTPHEFTSSLTPNGGDNQFHRFLLSGVFAEKNQYEPRTERLELLICIIWCELEAIMSASSLGFSRRDSWFHVPVYRSHLKQLTKLSVDGNERSQRFQRILFRRLEEIKQTRRVCRQ
jgi:hypothetical protein